MDEREEEFRQKPASEEELEHLRNALRGDGSRSWIYEMLDARPDALLSLTEGAMGEGAFRHFPAEVAREFRSNSLVLGAHAVLQSMEQDEVPREPSEVIRDMQIEGLFHNAERSAFDSKRLNRAVLCFSFAEVPEAEEAQSIALYNTEDAAVSAERELREFRLSELDAFLEDAVRTRVYLSEEGVVISHAFEMK